MSDPTAPTTGTDPTKTLLSESSLNDKDLCDYVVNVATGCRHGCKFCYVPATPNIRARPEMLSEKAGVENPQGEWGEYVLYRDGLGERLADHLDRKRTWRETTGGQGIVGVSFSTDCYMDGRAGKITRNVVEALTSRGLYTRILTRNPILALQDQDVIVDAEEYVTIGSSIPTLDAELSQAIEPSAPAPQQRLRGLQKWNDLGVTTFVSMSPTYPTHTKADLREVLEAIQTVDPDVVFHEPINPRAGNFDLTVQAAADAGLETLASELKQLEDRSQWVEYAVDHFRAVQSLAAELDIDVHLWPDDQLLSYLDDGNTQEWLATWKARQSPEDFADRPSPDTEPPALPTSPHRSTSLTEF
ncbi:radical SAM protein [Halobaculum sp. MBLA0147]|uniref:SPL family radical SAM protein n=1 Tax=Halobaculum sp. MBLA0147 TaxID=3079934 RepID=UPI003524FF6E